MKEKKKIYESTLRHATEYFLYISFHLVKDSFSFFFLIVFLMYLKLCLNIIFNIIFTCSVIIVPISINILT